MQFLPLYVTKNYIDPSRKRVKLLTRAGRSLSVAPGALSDLRRLFCSGKIKSRSPLCYARTASYFVDTFLTGKIKDPAHAATVKKSYIHITETKDNTCRLLPLNLRSGTNNVEDLGECKKDKTILLP